MFIVILPARIQNVCTRRKATKKIRRLQQRILGNFWKYSRLLHSVILFSRRGHPKPPGLRENMEAVLLYYLLLFPFNKCFCFFLFLFLSVFCFFLFFPKTGAFKTHFFSTISCLFPQMFFFSNPTLDLAEQNTVAHYCETAPSIYSVIPIKKAQKKTAKEKCIKKRRQSRKKKRSKAI